MKSFLRRNVYFMFKPSNVLDQILDALKTKGGQSIAVVFGLNAFLFGNWTVRMPDFKQNLNMDDQQVGFALLGAPIGALIAAGLCRYLLRRYGVGVLGFTSLCVMILMVFCLNFAWSYYSFFGFLLLFGIANGALDITMNGIVTGVEQAENRSLMSRAHGFWSIGAMGGSLFGSIMAGLGLPIFWHLFIVLVICFAFLLPYKSTLIPVTIQQEVASKKRYWPSRRLWWLIVIIFMMFMIEGGILQWSSIFYDEALLADEYLWGLGFGAFAITMAYARFVGDTILNRWQPIQVAIICSIVILATTFMISVSINIWMATLFMALTGGFCSVMVPIVMREAARDYKIPPAQGIAMASMFGYSGFLIGPPSFGIIADRFDIRAVYMTLAILMLVVVGAAVIIKRRY